VEEKVPIIDGEEGTEEEEDLSSKAGDGIVLATITNA
jgi:hypothetical protein